MPTQKGKNRAPEAIAATTAVRRCWSSMFPDDLLAVVFHMLDSPRVRARFVAVCRSWQAAARAAPPVALPWLLLISAWNRDAAKRLYCPEDRTIVRDVRLPADERDLVGCHAGGWVATFMPTPASLRIVNISSGAKVKLTQKQERLICGDHVRDSFLKIHVFTEMLKIVFSEPPTSPGCILATILSHNSIGQAIGLCKIACPNSAWTIQRCHTSTAFVDIAFYNGELYGLAAENGCELVVKSEIGANEDGAPVVIAERQLTVKSIGDSSPENFIYIFDLHGKLAVAKRAQWSLNLEPFFKVFELVDIHANDKLTACYKHRWVEVTNLGGHALFLGQPFSAAVHVTANGRGGVERNTIYFSYPCSSPYRFVRRHDDSYPYYMEDDKNSGTTDDEVKRIRTVRYFKAYTAYIDEHSGTWVLPPDI